MTTGPYLSCKLGVLSVTALILLSPPALAQNEQAIPNTQALDLPFTTPQQALDMIRLPEGFSATLFASEPDIIQPIAATTDTRGRLWVVENLTYSDGQQNYDTSLRDRIVILEDTDNDGEFDKRVVFWDQGSKLTGIELGFGGVWLTSAPNLLFLPDADRDDRADGPPTILLDGFEGDVIRHNIVNGLRWGPDGWLYGRHGIQATSHVGPPGSTASQRIPMNCSIWRFHPIDRRFEIVAEGSTNPWGFDYDEHGEMFMINTVIGHLFHVVPGARYRRMYGAHFNPHTYDVIEQTADHFHWDMAEPHTAASNPAGLSSGTDAAGGGHAHTGLMIYLGDNWPQRYRNQLFTANFHGRRLNCDRIERKGNGYVGLHEADLMLTEDPWFRGVEMIYGPDGGVYVLDWSDIGECHENDGIHRTSGRIFKLTYGTSEAKGFGDVAKFTDQELIQCHFAENEWFVRQARRVLQEKAVLGDDLTIVIDGLLDLIRSSASDLTANRDPKPALRALWSLHSTGAADERFLLDQLVDRNEHVRAWAVRLLADRMSAESPSGEEPADATVKAQIASRFAELAFSDPSGLVRLYICSALNRFAAEQQWLIAKGLASHSADSLDRTQPKLLWYRIEPSVTADPASAIELARESQFPSLRVNIVRRLFSELHTRGDFADSVLQWLAAEERPRVRADILRGMNLALEGWAKAPLPETWPNIAESLSKSETLTAAVRKLDLVFGEGRAIEELRNMAADPSVDTATRRQAIEQLSITRPPDLFALLDALIRDKSLSNAVIAAMVHCDEPRAANSVINRYPHLDPQGKTLAIGTLTSRKPWCRQLLRSVEQGKIPKEHITALHARQIRDFQDPDLSRQLEETWGMVRETSAEKQEQIKSLSARLSGADMQSVDRGLGEQVFRTHCANCHVLFGQGATTGPDLTGGDRRNLNYLLENIVDPSASLADTFRASVFMLTDGRLISGVVLEEFERTVRIQTAEEIIVLDRQQIEESRVTESSLMPDGLLDKLTPEETRALFAYLMD